IRYRTPSTRYDPPVSQAELPDPHPSTSDRQLPGLRPGSRAGVVQIGSVGMLRITKLADAEYLIGQVGRGIDDYYMGIGEAPGVWQGQLAGQLGLSGVVQDDDLRALLLGR